MIKRLKKVAVAVWHDIFPPGTTDLRENLITEAHIVLAELKEKQKEVDEHFELQKQKRMICVRQTKSKKKRYIPVNQEAMKTLRLARSFVGSPFVFPNPYGNTWADLHRAFKRACKRAGIKDFRWHDMRHDFASRLAMNGETLQTIMVLLGHSTMHMTLRYAHLSPDYCQGAVDKLCEDKSQKVGTNLAQAVGDGTESAQKPQRSMGRAGFEPATHGFSDQKDEVDSSEDEWIGFS